MSIVKIQQQNKVISFMSRNKLEENVSGLYEISIGYAVLKRLGYLITFHRNLDMYNQGRVTYTLMREGPLTRQFERECGKNMKRGIMIDKPRSNLEVQLLLKQRFRKSTGNITPTRFTYDIAYVILKQNGKILDVVCGDMFGSGSTFRSSLMKTYTDNELPPPVEWVCSFNREY